MMKTYLAFLSSIAVANAGVSYPTIVADLKDSGINPELQWKASTSVGSVDMEGGVRSSMPVTADLTSLPKSIWGKVASEVAGWGVTQRFTVDLKNNAPVSETTLVNKALDTSFKSVTDFENSNVQVSKGFSALGGRAYVNPRFYMSPKSSSTDVVLGYDTDGTSVQVGVSKSVQKLTVSQQITDDDQLTPSVTSKGDMALSWKRALGGRDSITTTLKVNESLSLKWNDGPWTATITTPIENFPNGEVNVKVNRKLNLS